MLTEKPTGDPITVYVSPNNYNDLYFLRREIDSFQFNCVRCHKLVTKKFWKKSHIEKYYIKFLCQSCINEIRWEEMPEEKKTELFNKVKENWANKTPEEQQALNEKTQRTKQKKYNDPYYNNIEKSKQTNLENLGVENVFQDENIKEKSKQTKIIKYDDPNYNNPEQISATKQSFSEERKQEIADKTAKTLTDKYGEGFNSVGDLNRIPEIQEKSKQTKEDLYGDPYYYNPDKVAKTFEDHFGEGIKSIGDYAVTPECRNKMEKTCTEKYNNPTYFGSQDHIDKTSKAIFNKYELKDGLVLKNDNHMFYPQTKEFADKMIEIGYPDAIGCSKINYYHTVFDSKWELAVWIYYIDHNVFIIRSPCKFEYLDLYGQVKYYHPDFWINGIGLIEIKGDQFFDENGNMIYPYSKPHHNSEAYTDEEIKYWNYLYEAKHQCGLKNNVIFWREKDIQKYIKYVNNTRFDGFLDLFKLDNPFNPTYSNLNGYYNICNPMISTPIYYTPLLPNNQVTPNNKMDNNGYVMNDNSRGITPFDIGK